MPFVILAVISVVSLSFPARADLIQIQNESVTDCRIVRVVGGRVIARVGDNSKSFDLADVQRVEITGLNKLTKAEDARAQKQWSRASALYVEAGRNTSRAVQNLTQARLIRVLDERGQWAEAVRLFLAMYAAEPSDAAWALRPANMPEEKSVMLPESAKLVDSRMKEPAFQTVQAQRHMKQLLVDIYLQMNDPRAAQLARQLQQAVDGNPAAAAKTATEPASPASQPASVEPVVRQIDDLRREKKWSEALTAIEAAIEKLQDANAAQLAVLRADVLAESGKQDDALLAYIQIPAMNNAGTWGGAALLKAADLQQKLGRDEAATRLYREVMDKYPDTLWAKEAQQKMR